MFAFSLALALVLSFAFAFVAACFSCGWQERSSTTDRLDCANAIILHIPLALLSSLLVIALELELRRVGFVLDPLLLA
jgi:hypothetical protein